MTVRSIRPYTVLPCLPDRLHPLQTLAYNLWWSGTRTPWRCSAASTPICSTHSTTAPSACSARPIRRASSNWNTTTVFSRTWIALPGHSTHYLKAPTWFQETYGTDTDVRIAYFSAEFGIHESVPVYSGGLGVLAGDHLKSASDLGLPLVGVSLMYREGYFRQYLNVEGWQQERYPENDFFTLPLVPEVDDAGKPIIVTVSLPGRELCAADLAHSGRPSPAVPARCEHSAELARRPRDHLTTLRRRHAHAHSTGNHPRHRRHPRLRALGQDADRLPHERRTRGVHRPGTHPLADGGTQARLRRRRWKP